MSAVISPRMSSAHRWVGGRCTASPALSALSPDDPSSPAAERGHRLHAVAAAWLTSATEAQGDDREMVEPYVRAVERAARDGGELRVELRVDDPTGRYGGTPDAVVIDRSHKLVHVIDLKTGWGVVEARENWQLLAYALLLAPALEGWSASLTIVQPGPWHVAGPVRTWRVDADALELYRGRFDSAVAEVFGADPRARAGAHCQYCRALALCPAASAVTLAAADYAAEPRVLPDDALARELSLMRETERLVSLRVASLEEVIGQKLRVGGAVAGAYLESARGRTAWKQEDATVLAMILMMSGVDVARKVAPTPKQAIDAGVPRAVVDSLSEVKPGATKVRTDPDKKAKQAFG